MFLTITIDTTRSKKIKLNRSIGNPEDGWKKALNNKKRSLFRKLFSLKKPTASRDTEGQKVMF